MSSQVQLLLWLLLRNCLLIDFTLPGLQMPIFTNGAQDATFVLVNRVHRTDRNACSFTDGFHGGGTVTAFQKQIAGSGYDQLLRCQCLPLAVRQWLPIDFAHRSGIPSICSM